MRQASSRPFPWARSARVRIVPSTVSRKPEWDRIERQLAGLDPGEVKDVIDDRQKRIRRVLDNLQILSLAEIQLGIEHKFGHADHPVHRGPNLVAHVGEEFALGLAGCLGSLPGHAQVIDQAQPDKPQSDFVGNRLQRRDRGLRERAACRDQKDRLED